MTVGAPTREVQKRANSTSFDHNYAHEFFRLELAQFITVVKTWRAPRPFSIHRHDGLAR